MDYQWASGVFSPCPSKYIHVMYMAGDRGDLEIERLMTESGLGGRQHMGERPDGHHQRAKPYRDHRRDHRRDHGGGVQVSDRRNHLLVCGRWSSALPPTCIIDNPNGGQTSDKALASAVAGTRITLLEKGDWPRSGRPLHLWPFHRARYLLDHGLPSVDHKP
jgi:hypothetical protein